MAPTAKTSRSSTGNFDKRLEKLQTRRVHQKRKSVVSFPESGREHTIKCGVGLQGFETRWYLMKKTFEPGKVRKGKSSKAVTRPYDKPQGTLIKELPIDLTGTKQAISDRALNLPRRGRGCPLTVQASLVRGVTHCPT